MRGQRRQAAATFLAGRRANVLRVSAARIALLVVITMAISAGRAGAIVGGSSVSIASAPWTVALLLKSRGAEQVRCSGVIVDSLHVVTAAHCLYRGSSLLRPEQIFIRAGASNVITPNRNDPWQQRSVQSFLVHPDLRGGADVALLHLSRALTLDRVRVAPIALNRDGSWRSGQIAILAGFGRQDPKLPPSGVVKQVGERVDPQGSCGKYLLSSPDAALLMCASSPVGASCFGDSGAGFVSSGPDPTLIGIESSAYGQSCRAGQTDRYVYVGAAEIWRFIAGDTRPPLAPRNFNLNLWAVPPRVGEPILCDGFGAGKARTRYVLSVDGRPILSSSHPLSYTIRKQDVGRYFDCRGSATNAGGTSVEAWKSKVVKP